MWECMLLVPATPFEDPIQFFYSKSTENLRAKSLRVRATNLAKLLLVNMFISLGVKKETC